MSRFFATGSDSGSDTSSEEEQVIRQPTSNFIFGDDEEDKKRIVRSLKEKRYEELTLTIKQIRNHKKINDMSSLLTSFEELTRAYTKAFNTVILKEEKGIAPRIFVRCLVEMEDFINDVWDDRVGRKNLSKNNSKSLASLRQKFRKYVKDFESDLAKFRENPDLPDQEEDQKEDEYVDSDKSESEDEAPATSLKKTEEKVPKVPKTGGDSDSDDSFDWGSDSDSPSSSSEDEGQYQSIRERFLKKSTDKYDDEKKKKKERKDKPKKLKRKEDGSDFEWQNIKGGVAIPSEKPKMFAKDAEISLEAVLRKLTEVIAARGKKRTDRREQIELLHEMLFISEAHSLGLGFEVKIKMSIISSIFDYNPNISDAMKPDIWSKLLDFIDEFLDSILPVKDTIFIGESVAEYAEILDKATFRVHGCVLTIAERLDEEFTKFLKECDSHSNDYVQRLKDEKRICDIIDKVQLFLEHQNIESEICRIYMLKIDHLYYKFDPLVLKQKKGEILASHKTNVQIMENLCKYIYDKDGTDRLRTRAILCHVYHHALHDNWFQARDLVLMSHLQETIQHSDPATQILYNRTMANIGLCAFRQGYIKDAHNCLVDLMTTSKVKELLAQGLLPQRQHERSKEQEKVEKQRQVPFHMHINLERLECVYLVSAMLIEIPYMASHEFDARRRMISKTFYQLLRSFERQSLVGPPESMREHVVAASKAMRNGDWSGTRNFIINEKMNAKVWELFHESDRIRSMLERLIKEESLRTYLFTYSHVYNSISTKTLSEMFELPKSTTHSILSKMIINEELMASLDDPTQTVVMHHSEPSMLQSLALQLADKVNNFVHSNERTFEIKHGNIFPRGGTQNRGQYRQNFDRQGGGGYGGHVEHGNHGGHESHGGHSVQDRDRQRQDNRNNY